MAQPELIKDIEARVKDTGDIMTGNLKVPDLDIASDICRGSIYGETNSLNFRGGNPTTEKYTYLKIAEDGAYIDNQKIYYPGNKPTPEDIGAAPASHASDETIHVTADKKGAWDESIQIEHIDAALPFTRSVRLASGNGIFVALAVASDEAIYSKNGARWTKTKLPTSVSDSWTVCYGNGKFVAIAYRSDVAIYSEDGVTWTQTIMPASLDWQEIAYGGGKFVAIARSSENFAYSADGVTWTLGTMPARLKWKSITYGAGKFVTIANSSTAAAYSEDGVTWTRTDLPSSTAWYSVAYGNGKFFAVPSNDNSAAYSEDGVTWTKQVTPSNKQLAPTITFGDGKFVIIYQGTNWVLCSEECKVWNKYLLPEQNFWRDITFGNGRFVTCAFTNGDSPNTAVALSDNGIVWNDFIDVIQTASGTDVTAEVKEIIRSSSSNVPHAFTHATGGSDPITPASIGAAPAGYGSFGETLTEALVLDDEDGALLRNKLIEIAQSMKAPNTKRIFFHAAPFVESYWNFGIVSSFVNETGKLRVILDAYMTNGHVWKMMYKEGDATEWTEPEFQNPILLVGKEYRTTERYQNKAVYKKLDSDGVIKWRLDGEDTWHTDKLISRSITLSASAWNSTAKTQTITVSGVLADETKQLITPAPALASQTAYYEAVVLCTGQAANQLTFTAKKIPTTDLTVYVTIQEVSA